MKRSKRVRRLVLGVVAALAAGLTVVAVAPAGPASAHGSTTMPPSRNYGCWARWGSDFQNPNMANVDPMCWQAWQANPNTMWNWNALYRQGVAGNHQAAIPDGQLCSGGRTQDGFYASLDAVGPWVAQNMANNFTLTITDQAQHGADYLLIYITKQGFDELTQPLKWSDLELVTQTGKYAPAGQYQAQVNAGNRTGRHVVYTIWQASHMDQSYYFCSDVIFGNGGGNGSASPSPSASRTGGASPSPSRTASQSPPGQSPPASTPGGNITPSSGTKACTAAYTKTSEWAGGFGGTVSVTAGTAAITAWTVQLTFANGQTITSSWNANLTSNGATVTATNTSYNGSLGAGQSTSFGFNGSWTGTNSPPTLSCGAR
jgi:lytic cellulose monooxygenase (C4-dehydrogenating)